MNYPQNYYFTREHKWVNLNSNVACIGLTELAMKELGTIKKLEIETLSQSLKKEQVFGKIQSEKYITKLIMPFDGEILEVNTGAFNNLTESYFHDHWLVKIKIAQPIDKSHLLSIDQYKSYKAANLLSKIKYLNNLTTQ